ncbi:MAG: adenine phosphoribosyltransferase [Gammaproteobacteria bacterium]|nr:adenine phosphoribosyltransferase [Gammaproteobacteria bacterium]
MRLEDYIYDVKDFPTKGILFKDITPLLNDKDAYKEAIDRLAEWGKSLNANIVMGPDARGFIVGCPVAYAMNTGFVPVRKPNKLPRETISESYDLEYGSNTLCIHKDALKKGDRVLIIDDLLATGGTIVATIDLAKKLGAEVVGVGVLIELSALKGRDLLKDINFKSLIKY